jgi:hypothetical protein
MGQVDLTGVTVNVTHTFQITFDKSTCLYYHSMIERIRSIVKLTFRCDLIRLEIKWGRVELNLLAAYNPPNQWLRVEMRQYRTNTANFNAFLEPTQLLHQRHAACSTKDSLFWSDQWKMKVRSITIEGRILTFYGIAILTAGVLSLMSLVRLSGYRLLRDHPLRRHLKLISWFSKFVRAYRFRVARVTFIYGEKSARCIAGNCW